MQNAQFIDDADARKFQRISVGYNSIDLEVMIYRGAVAERQPLLILNSIEMPVPPSIVFCEQMWAAGYQVIFTRRPGFGAIRGLPSVLMSDEQIASCAPTAVEAAILKLLIRALKLEAVILLGIGTSNSICVRLAQLSSQICHCVLSNPLFHSSIWDAIRPFWFAQMLKQTVATKTGSSIAIKGLKSALRRDPIWFYRQLAQKSRGDVSYIEANKQDFRQASLLLQTIEIDTFYYDLKTSLIVDKDWDPNSFDGISASILSSQEKSSKFQTDIENEAARLRIPIRFAGSGDLFVPYASPEELVDFLQAHATN